MYLVKEKEGQVSANQNEVAGELLNPVAALWGIELLYGRHPLYTESTYAVNFMTKLEGGASKCYLVIDLRERFDEYLKELNVFGSMEKAEFHKAIEYVKQLKVKGIFRRVQNLLSVMEGSAGADESAELFALVVDAVLSDPDAYPLISSDNYKHGVSGGVILDIEPYLMKYGESAVGVTTEALLEILNLEESGTRGARFMEIMRGWLESGHLLKRNRGPRLQEPIKPCVSSKEVRRFYVFRVENLLAEVEASSAE